MSTFRVWECQICNWIYDEEKGCPEESIEPGTRWQDIPDDWTCPECGVGKDDFEMIEVAPPSVEKHSQNKTSINGTEPPIIIIGTGYAGYHLLRSLRKEGNIGKVVMYTTDDGAFYSKPKLSASFSEHKQASQLISSSAEDMANQYQAEINIFTQIENIDVNNKCVVLAGGVSRSYSKLVLATGATPKQLPLEGNGLDKVLSVNNLFDYAKFTTLLPKKAGKVAIIGAGLIGCEFADDISRAGHHVSIIDPMREPLTMLAPEIVGQKLAKCFIQQGINMYMEQFVTRIDHSDSGVLLSLSSGETLSANLVLSAIGITPNIKLAKSSGLNTDVGVVVDKTLQTSVKDIFAVGDCAQVDNLHLPYIAPINAQITALVNNLLGKTSAINYPPMPVIVKTKLCPITVMPQLGRQGIWTVDSQDKEGVTARCINANNELLGFALTGTKVSSASTLTTRCKELL